MVSCSEVQREGACGVGSAMVNLVRCSAKELGKLVVKAMRWLNVVEGNAAVHCY